MKKTVYNTTPYAFKFKHLDHKKKTFSWTIIEPGQGVCAETFPTLAKALELNNERGFAKEKRYEAGRN